MASSLGGDDPSHDLSAEEKDREEKRLRAEERNLLASNDKLDRNK